MIQILHNPRCSKSREGLQFLKSKDIQHEEIKYMDHPLTAQEIKAIIKKLGLPAINLVRKKETIYKQKYAGKELSDDEWAEVMAINPKLIERPVVINGDREVIGRPIENIGTIL